MSNFQSYRGHPPHGPDDTPALRLARHEEAVERTLRAYDPVRAAWEAPTDEEIDEAALEAAVEDAFGGVSPIDPETADLGSLTFGELVAAYDEARRGATLRDTVSAALAKGEIARRVCSLGSADIAGQRVVVHGGRVWIAYPVDPSMLEVARAVDATAAEARVLGEALG